MPLDQSRDVGGFETSPVPASSFGYAEWQNLLAKEYVFFRVNLSSVIEHASSSVRAIMGYWPEELVGRDYREAFDLDHPLRAKYLEVADRFSASDPPGLRRTIGRRADGRLAFLWLREREIATKHGLVGRTFMVQDMTFRVETLLTLRQSERKYRRLVEGLRSEYVIYSRDPKGVLTYVSPSVKKVLGYEPRELIGTNGSEVSASSQRMPRLSERSRMTPGTEHSLRNLQAEIRHRDGSVRIMEINERPVFSIDGQLVSLEGIGRDVTAAVAAERRIRESKEDLERRVALRTEELQRMYEDLRASEARYRDVVETLNDFVVRWKPDGTRVFVNEAFARFHSLTSAELIGTSFVPTIHVEDVAQFREAMDSISPTNPSVTYEIRVRRRDGSYPWVQWNTRAKFDENGRIDHFQSVGRDVTALRAADDLLRQKEAHLAHLSRLATMGEMVAGIAHEISQPLHAAKTFAEAARRNLQASDGAKVEKAVECTSEISDAITRTVHIIRRLREFTKAQPFELEALSLGELAHEAAELAGYAIRRREAKLRFDLDERLPTILGDRIQLEQLVVNLLVNGCDAMERTPSLERILTVRTGKSGDKTFLSVSDAGCGVAPSDMHRLFEAFYTTKEEGMGMGLALCKSIAEAHGGDLRAERNQSGPGMTFTLTLPVTGGKS